MMDDDFDFNVENGAPEWLYRPTNFLILVGQLVRAIFLIVFGRQSGQLFCFFGRTLGLFGSVSTNPDKF